MNYEQYNIILKTIHLLYTSKVICPFCFSYLTSEEDRLYCDKDYFVIVYWIGDFFETFLRIFYNGKFKYEFSFETQLAQIRNVIDIENFFPDLDNVPELLAKVEKLEFYS